VCAEPDRAIAKAYWDAVGSQKAMRKLIAER